MSIRRLHATPVSTYQAQLGEGPVWDEIAARIMWVDISGKLVLSTDPATGRTDTFDTPSRVGAVGLVDSGGFVLALEDGLYLGDGVEPWHRLAAIEPDDKTTRMNDGKCDPAGAFVGGTMSMDGRQGRASLYRIDGSGEVQRLLEGLTISNGLVWTVDGTSMFHIDTPTRTVMRYEYVFPIGGLGPGHEVVRVPNSQGFPDGMTLDSDGCLWVAMWEGNSVCRYTPDGVLDTVIGLPVSRVTACTFGGPDLDTLFITTALAEAGGTTSEPESGGLFAASVGVSGHLPHRFRAI